MDDGCPKANVTPNSEAPLAASAATGERLSRGSRSAVYDLQDNNDRPVTAAAKGDGGRHGSRSHRSGGSSTPRPNTSSRRHKHRSQGTGSPTEGAGDTLGPQDSQKPQDGGGRPRALLSCCKGETHSHREGFRRLARRLHDAGALAARFAKISAEPHAPAAAFCTTNGEPQCESMRW